VPATGALVTVRLVVSEFTDAELLVAHVAGDRDAFAELFTRHRRQLHRLATVSCGSAEDAADALQEAMLAAHRGAAAFRHHAAVSSWLHRIVVNACLDEHRRQQRNQATVALDAEAHLVEDRTAQVETAVMVHRALRALTDDQRAAVEAVDMQGYSVADAARLLGVAEGTVKSRCARARARLAMELRQQDCA
jgi:RNA polymerase sigma-70 factor (ECF subfamily)